MNCGGGTIRIGGAPEPPIFEASDGDETRTSSQCTNDESYAEREERRKDKTQLSKQLQYRTIRDDGRCLQRSGGELGRRDCLRDEDGGNQSQGCQAP